MKREKPISDLKLKRVKELAELMKKNKTIMVVSIKSIPGNQFQEIKKKLMKNAKVRVMKKSTMLKAVEEARLDRLKEHVHEDVAILFSDMDAFELSAILAENQTAAKAKAGQIADEDIAVEPGPTDLAPGPAISELGAVGLKIKIEEGKIAIQERKIIAKKGEKITDKAAAIMEKLNIMPFKVGFLPEAAYDTETRQVYIGIRIDKEKTLEELKEAARKAFGMAVSIGYVCEETISYLIRKAGAEERKLDKLIKEESEQTQQNIQEDKQWTIYMELCFCTNKEKKSMQQTWKKVIEATGAEVDESKIKVLVASLKGVDIDKELESAAMIASAPVQAGKQEAKVEEKKEEKVEEAAEGLSALFG